MKRRLLALPLLACFLLALVLGNQPEQGDAKPLPRVPKGFFGIVPQTGIGEEDLRYMKAGGVESIRLSLPWAQVQPTPKGPYNWTGFDPLMEMATRAGLRVLPSIGSPPKWATGKETTMPVASAKQRKEWKRFLSAAVARYGPGGDFWDEHATGGIGPGPTYEVEPPITRPMPIREWQIWNESNFFYFAYPVSPSKYAKLVTLSSQAIKAVDPRAKVVLAGLFAEPTAKGKKGMPATTYLQRLYAIPGFKARFDGIDLHPYAVDYQELERMTEEFHDVAVENRDRPGLYITELGWGSQNNFQQVAFEQGIRGQVKQLRGSYAYMMENARRLNLKSTYWFSWKDLPGSCTFCDSVGLFRAGPKFKPKPAWHAFVALTGGRARP
ncbi:MAG TPA: beta-galactosidase [Solirubrobacterales bacterium]|nr:beta-galactosidase [Solirubrobacterales bacterium]